MSVVDALATAVLPVRSIVAVGYAPGRLRDVDVDSPGTVTMYVLVPALVFPSLATTAMGGPHAAGIAAGVVLFTVVVVLVSEGTGRAIDETVARTFVPECAMPAAITPLIFAIEFDVPVEGDVTRPAYLSTAIPTTTSLSVATSSVLIVVLESGAVI